MNRKQPWKNQLWNVSLFPALASSEQGSGPPEPAPRGGSSLGRPALLTVTEEPANELARAA